MYRINGKALRILIAGICSLALLACSSPDFSYVSRDDLRSDPLYLIGQSDMKKPKNYGAFKFQKESMDEDEGGLFILQKKKGVYQTETMFENNKGKKYFFSFGLNYKKQEPHVGLRVEF